MQEDGLLNEMINLLVDPLITSDIRQSVIQSGFQASFWMHPSYLSLTSQQQSVVHDIIDRAKW